MGNTALVVIDLDMEYHFDLDVCALPGNAKCKRYFTPQQDGLTQNWDAQSAIWCNPPYGRQIGRWVKKAFETAHNGCTVVMLLPARTDTKWFHEYIYGRAEIRFLRGRVKFGNAVHGEPFPSMVVVFKGVNKS